MNTQGQYGALRPVLAAIFSCLLLPQFPLKTLAQSVSPCGQEGSSYFTEEIGLVCLEFPFLAQKVVFTPKIDNFESLQIKGLFDLFPSTS